MEGEVSTSWVLDIGFCRCIPILLEVEGMYVNNPKDPGGETNWGISKRSYPNLDIKAITAQEAAQIYYNDFWCKAGCVNMQYPLAGYVFIDAVNMGVVEAVKLLQQQVGVSTDGVVGPQTLQAANALPVFQHYKYLQMLLNHYRTLPGWATFGHGWENRLLRQACL